MNNRFNKTPEDFSCIDFALGLTDKDVWTIEARLCRKYRFEHWKLRDAMISFIENNDEKIAKRKNCRHFVYDFEPNEWRSEVDLYINYLTRKIDDIMVDIPTPKYSSFERFIQNEHNTEHYTMEELDDEVFKRAEAEREKEENETGRGMYFYHATEERIELEKRIVELEKRIAELESGAE